MSSLRATVVLVLLDLLIVPATAEATEEAARDAAGQAGQATRTAGAVQETLTEAQTPDLTVGDVNVGEQLSDVVQNMKAALEGVTDVQSAEAALPALNDINTKLEELSGTVGQLPDDAKKVLADFLDEQVTELKTLADRVTGQEGVGDVLKPALEPITAKLDETRAETDTCPYPRRRTIEDLAAALAAHAEWLEQGGNPDVPGRANFCNADLFGANLKGAILTQVNLEKASLGHANLEGADLEGANLKGARLEGANLERARMIHANLELALLINAKLNGARLFDANLERANLFSANLEGANLFSANLEGAVLDSANLERAHLQGANLQRARLKETVLENARLSHANLSEARYQPATAPAPGYLSGLRGLRSISFCPGEGSGLIQLRQALKAAGLRELEREATYRLESLRTDYALARWNGMTVVACEDLGRDRWAAIEGLFRYIFFELTTDYGLAYGRPIKILLGLILVFTLVYLHALLLVPKRPDHDSGIYRIWPKGRIKRSGESFEPADDEIIEPLKARGISALGLAFYFSVISAFHLGWRDLNVGTWIARMQPREYTLRAKGWPRVVSGVQSLISVYLVAMWVLTYFGRPFE